MGKRTKHSLGYQWGLRHALDNQDARAAWALQGRLEESQWYPAEAHAAYQGARLAELVAHAGKNVPFYSDRLHGFDFSKDRFDWDMWRQVPILRREDVLLNNAGMVAKTFPASHGQIFEQKTSGSSGPRLTVLTTSAAQSWGNAMVLRSYLWHLRRADGRLAIIRRLGPSRPAARDGDMLKRWGNELILPMTTGDAVRLDATIPIENQLDWLIACKPRMLLTYPSVLSGLLTESERTGRKPAGLRHVCTFGETLEPAVRSDTGRLWKASLFDIYSAEEIGTIAIQCPETNNYHVAAETVLVEILRDDGSTCASGEMGRVILTPLFNFAMPLLRYEIGDHAVATACRCGRALAALERIAGRSRGLIRRPDGRLVWPSFGARSMSRLAPVKQVQLAQKTPTVLELRVVEAGEGLSEEHRQSLIKLVTDRLGPGFNVTVTVVDTIERAPSGKIEETICLLDEDPG